MMAPKGLLIAFVGTHVDEGERRVVETKDAQEFASNNGMSATLFSFRLLLIARQELSFSTR